MIVALSMKRSGAALAATGYDTQQMIAVAKTLAADTQTYGQESDGTTHCNQFVRAWVAAVTGSAPAELNGLANDQISQMAASSAWKEITIAPDWDATYGAAVDAAKGGAIVLVAWANPQTTKTDHGHVAAVLPQDRQLGYSGVPAINGGNGYQVPMITEASTIDRDCTVTGVDASVRLSCGFGASKQPALRFFKLI